MLKKISFILLFLLTTQTQAREIILAEKAYVDDLATNRVRPSEMAAAITNALANYATISYVDSKTNAPAVPSWDTLKGMNWTGANWGVSWTVMTTNNANEVEGIGACFGNDSNNDVMSQANVVDGVPNYTGWGKNCFCKIAHVNKESVFGAWVFSHAFGSNADCYASCAFNCSNCVRVGMGHSCTRAAMFANP